MFRYLRDPKFTKLIAATTVAMALTTSACVSPHRPGVKIESLDADIVFGIAQPSIPPSPPGVPQFQSPAPVPPPELPADEPQLETPALPVPHGRTIIPQPAPVCPVARQGAFPALEASQDVTVTPAAGAYLWKPAPAEIFGADHFPLTQSQLFERTIGDVSPITKTAGVDATGPTPTPIETSTFTYKVTTFRADGTKSAVDTFQVEERATRASFGSNIGPTIRTGDPARGVSLKEHQDYDAKGNPAATFAPTSPLLLLPLDVAPSEQFQSVASDPTSGSSYTLNALVNKRSMVDACGEEVDGWEVNAQTSFTYAQSGANSEQGSSTVTQPAQYTYIVATQLGGLIIAEKVEPLQSIPTPSSGTAANDVLPKSTDVPPSPLPVSRYEISLASASPITPTTSK